VVPWLTAKPVRPGPSTPTDATGDIDATDVAGATNVADFADQEDRRK